MARNILILGASYGSLLATKLLMAGHNVTLVCRKKTAELINRDGTEVRIKLRDEPVHRAIFSRKLSGKLGKWNFTAPQRRLVVVETLMVGPKQRLLIIRRDDVEHLVLAGADGATVIESNIPPKASP